MNILEFLNRHKWWLLLAVLLILNVIRYWPVKHKTQGFAGGPPMAHGFPTPDAAMQARIDALPDDQKQAVNDWMQQQKDFFASVQSLPDDQKQQKMMEHFSQNPPPPGMPFPGGPGGQPGHGNIHVPPPEVRRGMDQGLVNAMKNGGFQ